MQRYLFICRANYSRSKSAERICKEIARENKLEITSESAGVSLSAARRVTREIASRADKIFVMEDYMKEMLTGMYQQSPKKITVLHIDDIYGVNDPDLEEILREKLIKLLLPSPV